MQTTGTLEEINIDYNTGKPKISFLINDKDKLSDIEQLKGVCLMFLKSSLPLLSHFPTASLLFIQIGVPFLLSCDIIHL